MGKQADPRAARADITFWKSLAEQAEPEATRGDGGEFPPGADLPPDAVSRRDFMTLVGASMALAGLSGCGRPPREKIVPYHDEPPEVTPGRPIHYATSMVLGGYAMGLLAESHVGRPTKLEGNPEHPASLGATGVFQQASVLGLYDPHRARELRRGTSPRTWGDLVDAVRAQGAAPSPGETHFLLEPTSSPTVIGLIGRIREANPKARFHFYDPTGSAQRWEGARLALGRALDVHYDLEQADVVVALDSDFLVSGRFHIPWARAFARRRTPGGTRPVNRLFVAEPAMTPTGAKADHRVPVRASDVGGLLAALLQEIGGTLPSEVPAALGKPALTEKQRAWLHRTVDDLRSHRGASVVMVGDRQPAHVHALALAVNAALGNTGRTVRYTEPAVFEAGEASHGLQPLVQALEAGRVQTLVILEGNPVYDSPGDLDFAAAMKRAQERVYLSLYENETARHTDWFVPAAHYLEAWGDARAYDGTFTFCQPLVAPLHDGHTVAEVLSVFAGRPDTAHALVRAQWRDYAPTVDFRTWWARTVQHGLLPDTASPTVTASVDLASVAQAAAEASKGTEPGGLELAFTPDDRVHDGRFTNNAWLLELPQAMTSLTWTNAAIMSPNTAGRLGVTDGRLVELRLGERKVLAPVLMAPGHVDDAVTVHLGWGRGGEAEENARDVGFDAYRLRTGRTPGFALGLEVVPTERKKQLAVTQNHWSMQEREPVRHVEAAYLAKVGHIPHPPHPDVGTFRTNVPEAKKQWGMTIDLSTCVGCNACVVACQAENNVPAVGEAGVRKGREMHWLRLDRYYKGPAEEPEAFFQPMLCQHCEAAPCEYVCPVNATVHSPDGLNEMVYNRCVGTRFCSNNCPYKVRRFNFFDYNEDRSDTEKLVMNPDVTVRARGVMEKCTFCVQRIRSTSIAARVDGREVQDLEIKTACQAVCPTNAIVFGDVADPESAVSKAAKGGRAYRVLEELATRPRIQYLAAVTNQADEVVGTDTGPSHEETEG